MARSATLIGSTSIYIHVYVHIIYIYDLWLNFMKYHRNSYGILWHSSSTNGVLKFWWVGDPHRFQIWLSTSTTGGMCILSNSIWLLHGLYRPYLDVTSGKKTITGHPPIFFMVKKHGFRLRCSLKPIQWTKIYDDIWSFPKS